MKAMSMALLRAGADVVGYEVRDDFASRAKKNVFAFMGETIADRYEVHIADAYAGIRPGSVGMPEGSAMFDRFILDLPEPWQVLGHATEALRPGGIAVAYTPSITQAQQVRHLMADGAWDEISTTEVLHRTWHIEGQAVRPDHRMVGHTAFLTRGRLIGPNVNSEKRSIRNDADGIAG